MASENKPLIEKKQSGYGTRENLVLDPSQAGPSNSPGQTNNPVKYGRGQKWPQYCAALSSTLGAFALGTVLGWISPAIARLTTAYGFFVGHAEISLLGSLVFLGAACILGPIECVLNKLGRRRTMLLLLIPFTIGWLCIILATKLYLIYIGRFVTGFASGGFCLITPLYIAEIAQKEIRGSLESMFPIMITSGILFAYIVGSLTTIILLSVLCAVIPIIFGMVFYFQPESPVYLIRQNRVDEARLALLHLRGCNFDVDSEIQEITAAQEALSQDNSFCTSIKKKSTQRALLISCGTMAFQQFTGLYPILAYSTIILESFSSKLPFETVIIFIGIVQFVGNLIGEAVVDTRGRKYLLMRSAIFMCISLIALGLYFRLRTIYPFVLYINYGLFPLLIISVYALAYCVGFGPVPWVLNGEIHPLEIKDKMAGLALFVNLVASFLVTQYFMQLVSAIGRDGTFYLFALICGLAAVFVHYVVIETKGKSLSEIQLQLESLN